MIPPSISSMGRPEVERADITALLFSVH